MSERPTLPLAILISGGGSNMVAIAQACAAGRIKAAVNQVICDRPDAAGIQRARDLGLKASLVARSGFPDEGAFERALTRTLEEHTHELVVLAGFMRVLSRPFVAQYAGRMLNIHPSLLPQYRGLHTHRRVLAAADSEHGASVHFVTAELDAGPVVLQSRVAVHAGDTEKILAERVQATEYIIYPKVIGWIAQGRLVCRDEQAWFDGERLDEPMVEDWRGVTQD
jgi:phosphoribosylglycinamide formyltransferase-1